MPPIYLDCNATTPLEPEVRDILLRFHTDELGNEGSRTHDYGARAKQAVQKARDQVAAVVAAQRDEVIFTSGATESSRWRRSPRCCMTIPPGSIPMRRKASARRSTRSRTAGLI